MALARCVTSVSYAEGVGTGAAIGPWRKFCATDAIGEPGGSGFAPRSVRDMRSKASKSAMGVPWLEHHHSLGSGAFGWILLLLWGLGLLLARGQLRYFQGRPFAENRGALFAQAFRFSRRFLALSVPLGYTSDETLNSTWL